MKRTKILGRTLTMLFLAVTSFVAESTPRINGVL